MSRTRGATSNVLVSLKQLNAMFNDDALIPVGRQFADRNHLIGKGMIANQTNIDAAGNQPALEEKVNLTEILPAAEESEQTGLTPEDIEAIQRSLEP